MNLTGKVFIGYGMVCLLTYLIAKLITVIRDRRYRGKIYSLEQKVDNIEKGLGISAYNSSLDRLNEVAALARDASYKAGKIALLEEYLKVEYEPGGTTPPKYIKK